MKIAISADWHVGYMKGTYLIKGKPNRELDMDRQIKFMALKCQEEQVDKFIIAGDLFHKNVVSGYYFCKVIDYIRTFSDKDIDVVLLIGNHEMNEQGDSVIFPIGKLREEGISVIDTVKMVLLDASGMKILYIPHIRKDVFKEYKNFTSYVKNEISNMKFSPNTIIVGHFQPKGFDHGSEESMFAGSTRFLDTKIFPDDVKIFAGHVHKPQENGNVYTPGDIVRYRIDEAKDVKSFLIYDFNKVERMPLNCQKMSVVKIDLLNKNSYSLPRDKIIKHKGRMVAVRITTSKQNRMKISQKEIFKIFERIGARIVSFKIDVHKSEVLLTKSKNAVLPKIILKRVVNNMIKGEENKKRIYNLGVDIYDKVCRSS